MKPQLPTKLQQLLVFASSFILCLIGAALVAG